MSPEKGTIMNFDRCSLIYTRSASVIQPKLLEESTSGLWGVAEKHLVGIVDENMAVHVLSFLQLIPVTDTESLTRFSQPLDAGGRLSYG